MENWTYVYKNDSLVMSVLKNQPMAKLNRDLEVKQSKYKYWITTSIQIFLTHTHNFNVIENAVFLDHGISGNPGYYD